MLDKYEIPPPKIVHQHAEHRPWSHAEIDTAIDLVKRNAKLSRNDSNLLRFYAKCKSNSTPPLCTVLQQTGIPDEKGWRRSRRKLQRLSLITYRNNGIHDHYIRVMWVVICGLAMLEKPLKTGGRDHKYFSGSVYKQALDNIANQVHLSQIEYDAIANIILVLSPADARKITNAILPEPLKQ